MCELSVLKYQQLEGLNTVLPYGIRNIEILRTLTTESLAVLMPFRVQEIMQENGIYYGQNTISKNMITINRSQSINGNSFILGVSGSGKSFITKENIAFIRMKHPDSKIIAIDPEDEFGRLFKALGGEVIKISSTSLNHINAMDINLDGINGNEPIVLKSEFILSLCEQVSGNKTLGPKEKSIIDRCTVNIYKKHKYFDNMPTLKDFRDEILKQPEIEAKEIALILELFTNGSLNTFSQQTNVDVSNNLICFNISELGKQLQPIGMLIMLDYINNLITKNKGTGKTIYIYIDEIYLLFLYNYAANYLYTLWKRARKYGAFCTGITQNISDLLQSHTAKTMLANSEFLILLNQASTDRQELAKLLNISDMQLSYITNVGAGEGLIKVGSNIVPFTNKFPRDTKLYELMTTKPSEMKNN